MKHIIVALLLAVSAFATSPAPVFQSVGSAHACVGGLSGSSISDFAIDPNSGYQYVATDGGNGVCRSTDHGATWAQFNTGGPLICKNSPGLVKGKKLNFMPDGTLLYSNGVCGGINSGYENSNWWLDNISNRPGFTWTMSTGSIFSAEHAIFGHGANLGAANSAIAPHANLSSPTSGGFSLTSDNGRSFHVPTGTYNSPVANGDTFGALKDPASNTVYLMIGNIGGLADKCIAYTTDPDGANWQYTVVYAGVCTGDPWSPIIVPPGHGSYSGLGMTYFGTGNGGEHMWAFGPLTSPNGMTFNDVTGNLFTLNGIAMAYGDFTVGIDWNNRVFINPENPYIGARPAYSTVWTDSIPTYNLARTVTGNTLPDYTTSPCTGTQPTNNPCVPVATYVDKFPSSPTYGKVFMAMRDGRIYATTIPQSHKASTFNFPLGAVSIAVGGTATETISVGYLDQDTSDPTCPAITGNPPLYPNRAAGTFSSSDSSVAVIDSTGHVTGVAPGTAYPLFTCGGVISANGPAITVTGSGKPFAILPAGITATGAATYSGTVLDTTYSLPVGGTNCAAHNASQLTACLNSVVPGDVITCDAGVTYSGNFHLPAKTNPSHKWIYLQSSAYSSLPAPGTRVGPSDAPNMCKLVSPNITYPLTVNNSANYWRIVGVELTANSNYPTGCGVTGGPQCMTYFLVNFAFSPVTGSDADHIWFDRVYGHGSPTQDLQGGIIANWNNYALIDSYLDDIHIRGFDSPGTGCYHCLGPIKINNNYIAASSENIIFGGAGGNNNPGVPSDIEIQNNYLFKPLSWVPLSMNQTLPNSMVVKNCFEVKNGQRILFNNNVCENVWAGGQLGYAIVLSVRSGQSGDFAVDNDITITNNALKNVVSGVNTQAVDDQCAASMGYPNCHNAGSQDRWNIYNNLITFYDPTALGGNRNVVIALSGGVNGLTGVKGTLRNVVFQHNTAIPNASTPNTWGGIYVSSSGQTPPFPVPPTDNVWILDNVLPKPISGDYGYNGGAALSNYMANPAPVDLRFSGNEQFCQGVTACATGTGPYAGFPATNLQTNTAFTYNGNQVVTNPAWTTTVGPPSPPFQSGWMGIPGTPTLLSITVTPANTSITVGIQQQFAATCNYSDGSSPDCTGSATWTSGTPSVATINSAGLAMALSTGSSVITATYQSIAGHTTLTVSGSTPTLVSIDVTPHTFSVVAGSQKQYTAIGTYSDASTKDLTTTATWNSATPSVATINSAGLAVGVTAGTSNITAAYQSITSNTAVLTVTLTGQSRTQIQGTVTLKGNVVIK